MFYNDYGFATEVPINYDGEQALETFWSVVDEYGENYAQAHSEIIVEAMEQANFYYNSKINDKQSINKFWSLTHEQRIDILYTYFNDDPSYWGPVLKEGKE